MARGALLRDLTGKGHKMTDPLRPSADGHFSDKLEKVEEKKAAVVATVQKKPSKLIVEPVSTEVLTSEPEVSEDSNESDLVESESESDNDEEVTTETTTKPRRRGRRSKQTNEG